MSIPLPPPETPEQRKARQFTVLHHVGLMAHDLSTDAHARAKEQLATKRAQPKPPHPTAEREIDYAATFASLVRAVRQAIALEHRLDAPTRTRPAYRDAAPLADPRRILLRRVFHDAVAKHPDAPRLRRESDTRIDDELRADPDHLVPIQDHLVTLHNTLQIDLDLSRIPDELLGMPKRPPPFPDPS